MGSSSSFFSPINNLSNEDVQNYWVGPYNIRVPDRITTIKAGDGCNTIYHSNDKNLIPGQINFSGCLGLTEMKSHNPLTEEEYKNKYCVLVNDHYYWNGNNSY